MNSVDRNDDYTKSVYVLSDLDGLKYKLVMKGDLKYLGTKKIKRHLEKSANIPSREQLITLNGVVLRDDQNGDEIGLKDGIVLVLRRKADDSVSAQARRPSLEANNVSSRTPNSKSYDKIVSISPATGHLPLSAETSKSPRMTNMVSPGPSVPLRQANVNTSLHFHHKSHDRSSQKREVSLRGASEVSEVSELTDSSQSREDDSPILQSPSALPLQHSGSDGRIRHHRRGSMSAERAQDYIAQLESQNALLREENAVMQKYLKKRGRDDGESALKVDLQKLKRKSISLEEQYEEKVLLLEEKWILKEEEYARELDLLREQRKNLIQDQNRFESEQQVLLSDLNAQLLQCQTQLSHKDNCIEEMKAELEHCTTKINGLEEKVARAKSGRRSNSRNSVREDADQQITETDMGALAHRVLCEVSNVFGLGDLEIDENNNTCVVNLTDPEISLLFTLDKVTGRLYMYVTLLDFIPKSNATRCRLYETLLQGALLGKDMAGGGVGICLNSEIVLMSTSIDLRHTASSALAVIARPFVEAAATWTTMAEDIASTNE